jgi:hypothetical protein
MTQVRASETAATTLNTPPIVTAATDPTNVSLFRASCIAGSCASVLATIEPEE